MQPRCESPTKSWLGVFNLWGKGLLTKSQAVFFEIMLELGKSEISILTTRVTQRVFQMMMLDCGTKGCDTSEVQADLKLFEPPPTYHSTCGNQLQVVTRGKNI